MFKTCVYCHKVVDEGHICPNKPTYKKHNEKINKFRNSPEWKRMREEIQKRDNYMCAYCFSKHRLTYIDLSVHHITFLVENWDLRLNKDNLITLCRQCHENAEKGKISKQELIKLVSPTI